MKYLNQIAIILVISFVGELLNYYVPLPIPAGIYGIVILFLGLIFKLIPYDSVKDVAHLLVDIMPIMFISPAVGLMETVGVLKSSWVPYVSIIVISTILVMAVSGKVTQFVIRKKQKRGNVNGTDT